MYSPYHASQRWLQRTVIVKSKVKAIHLNLQFCKYLWTAVSQKRLNKMQSISNHWWVLNKSGHRIKGMKINWSEDPSTEMKRIIGFNFTQIYHFASQWDDPTWPHCLWQSWKVKQGQKLSAKFANRAPIANFLRPCQQTEITKNIRKRVFLLLKS